MNYTKTKKMVSIRYNDPGYRSTIERRIYEDEYQKEWVIINRCFIPLESYEIDPHYDVQRYY